MIGIDEVGRGSWAGPLVVCALRLENNIEGLTDSKLLTKKRREELFEEIIASNEYGIGWVCADEIDDIGLSMSLKLAAAYAVAELNPTIEKIIVDGSVQLLPSYTGAVTMIKADVTVPAVSAASIVAKVIRDSWMAARHEEFDSYDFTHNVGYGTNKHRLAIEQFGLTPLHRRSFTLPQQK